MWDTLILHAILENFHCLITPGLGQKQAVIVFLSNKKLIMLNDNCILPSAIQIKLNKIVPLWRQDLQQQPNIFRMELLPKQPQQSWTSVLKDLIILNSIKMRLDRVLLNVQGHKFYAEIRIVQKLSCVYPVILYAHFMI